MNEQDNDIELFNLPLETVLSVAQRATQKAAVDAVNAGRVVVGWKDGRLAEYRQVMTQGTLPEG